jgi:hypothetical protein
VAGVDFRNPVSLDLDQPTITLVLVVETAQ